MAARRDYDELLPFYDEGVRFSRFGEVVPVGTLTAPLLRELLDSKEEYLAEKRRALKDVAPRFTPGGTWQYILRRMRVPGALPEPPPDASHNPPADGHPVRDSRVRGSPREVKARPGAPQPDKDSAGAPASTEVSAAVAAVWHDIAMGRKAHDREEEEEEESSRAREGEEAERPLTHPGAGGGPPDAGGDAALLVRLACRRCGVNAAHQSGAPNCCSEGGAWYGMCDERGEQGAPFTWHEGFQACSSSRTFEASRRLSATSLAQEDHAATRRP